MLLKLLREEIDRKRVLLLGFGREGRSLCGRILQAGGFASLGIADQNPVPDAPECAVLHTGADYQSSVKEYDIVFKSPGVVLREEYRPERLACKVTSLTELFLTAYRDQCIGVTGTKGKSTTASLLCHLLRTAGLPAILGGNIGIPMADLYEQITPRTILVLEIGVHQLEFCHVSPKTAVFLNLFEEHLDHYGTFENYAFCKENIYRHQKPGDLLILGAENLPKEGGARVLRLAFNDPGADISLLGGDTLLCEGETLKLPENLPLAGEHNRLNCAVAAALAKRFGAADKDILTGLETFTPLPHRLTPIGEYHGIFWVDDSISTTCETCIEALRALPRTDTVLIGGMDRGISYTPLLEALQNCDVRHIILLSDSGKRIYEEAKAFAPALRGRMRYVPDLRGAVALAKRVTERGKICLLSPAAASYNEYKNFEERGDCFRALAEGGDA